jgi:hypothetical protein
MIGRQPVQAGNKPQRCSRIRRSAANAGGDGQAL